MLDGLWRDVAFAWRALLRRPGNSAAALDPATYVAAGALLLRTALLAAWIPAQRAALAEPLSALRDG